MPTPDLTLTNVAFVRDSSDPVPSPCCSVCRMDARRSVCEGCWRTLDEIGRWSRMDNAEKKAVWISIETRIAAAPHAVALEP